MVCPSLIRNQRRESCDGAEITPFFRVFSLLGQPLRYYRNNPPVIAAVESPSWTGCYVGCHSGLAAGHTTWQDTVPLGTIDATMSGQTANTDMSGAIYGAQIG